MTDDLAGNLLYSLRRLFDPCAPLMRRPAPRVKRIRDAENQPLVMITQRDDLILLAPSEARRLARQLFHVTRGWD